ncbi:MAG: alpha/beta fold hydrolase [Solirubrobacteraceae bacterium]
MAINHHRQGTGRPLVLLHGIGLRWQIFEPVIDLLAVDHEVIACDSPGFGKSPPLADGLPPDISAYTDAFERFFADEGLARPHVAGNSMGGAIALELARRGAVASATAISPAGFWTPRERAFCQASLAPLARTPRAARQALEAFARTRAGRTALLWQTFARPTQMPGEVVVQTLRDAWAAPAFADALAAFDRYSFDRGDELAQTPLTIVWGNQDRLLPYRTQAPRARELLAHARHVTLGAGHVPFYDDPAAVAEAIRAGARTPLDAASNGRAGAGRVPV